MRIILSGHFPVITLHSFQCLVNPVNLSVINEPLEDNRAVVTGTHPEGTLRLDRVTG